MATLLSGIDTLSVPQCDTLWPIARACPGELGQGVYLARALLGAALDTVLDYPDTCAVDTSALRRAVPQSSPLATAGSLSVYPNPADAVINIAYANPLAQDSDTRLWITDAMGRPVVDVTLHRERGGLSLTTSGMAAGTYLVHWLDNLGRPHNAKFVVIHR